MKQMYVEPLCRVFDCGQGLLQPTCFVIIFFCVDNFVLPRVLCTSTHMHTHSHIHTYTRTHINMRTNAYLQTHACTHAHTHT